MEMTGRGGAVAFFVTFCVCLVAAAVALNVGWIVLNIRDAGLLILGVIIFPAIITGLILNTTFLVREIRKNEQHDAFVNAVTHELKTPITSIRLYLETLKARGKVIAPWWQWVPIDLFAEFLPLRDDRELAYSMRPMSDIAVDPQHMLHRGEAMRPELQSSKLTRQPTTHPAAAP